MSIVCTVSGGSDSDMLIDVIKKYEPSLYDESIKTFGKSITYKLDYLDYKDMYRL